MLPAEAGLEGRWKALSGFNAPPLAYILIQIITIIIIIIIIKILLIIIFN